MACEHLYSVSKRGFKGICLNLAMLDDTGPKTECSDRVCRHVTQKLIRLHPSIVFDEKRYIARSLVSTLIKRTANSFLIMHRIAAFIFHASTVIFTVWPRK